MRDPSLVAAKADFRQQAMKGREVRRRHRDLPIYSTTSSAVASSYGSLPGVHCPRLGLPRCKKQGLYHQV
jgi:hypothetical protein